jgi:membrane-associated protease RseP (regulator of RpoE activity)
MNLTFSRSARSRIRAFGSSFAMAVIMPTFFQPTPSEIRVGGAETMKKYITAAVATAAAMALLVAWLAVAPSPASAQAPEVPVVTAFGPGAWIGVTARDVTADDASKAKMAQPSGVYVESVREGSPAAKAGIRNADIIVDFDDERIRSVRQFTRLVQETAPRRVAAVVVIRGTERQTLQVVPESSSESLPDVFSQVAPRLRIQPRDRDRRLFPRDFTFDFDPDVLPRQFQLDGPSLGVSVTPVTGQLADYFGVKSGVLVSSVWENTPAAAAGIKAGDVITAVDGRGVTSAADITDAMRRAAGEGVDLSVTRDKKPLMLRVLPAQPGSGRRGLPV